MKIRNGFVSNSSSSSFMVSVPKNSSKKVKIEIDLDTFCERTITTIEKLDRYFRDRYGEGVDFTKEEDYIEARKEILNGNEIMVGIVSNEDGGFSSYVYEVGVCNILKDNKDVKVIFEG